MDSLDAGRKKNKNKNNRKNKYPSSQKSHKRHIHHYPPLTARATFFTKITLKAHSPLPPLKFSNYHSMQPSAVLHLPHHSTIASPLTVTSPKLSLTQLHYPRKCLSLELKRVRLRVRVRSSTPESDPQTSGSDERIELETAAESLIKEKGEKGGGFDVGWLPVFPHVLTASMANFLFGYHIGVMNGPIEDIARELGFQGNPFLEGLVVSIFIVGAFIGSISFSSIVDNFGCKRTLQIDTIPLILGAFLSAQAHSIDEMLWGRFLVGLGVGVNTVLVPLYISEVAPTKYRGSLSTLCQIGTCLGIITALSLAIPSETDPHWWRTLFYIACVPGLALILGMQFAVESPRWLCKVGRLNEARDIIGKLWGTEVVEKSIEEIVSVVETSGNQSSWQELLVEPHKRVALIGGALFFLQQFAGINGVLYFSSLTFHDVGITSGALASLLVGITNFGGALVASYLIDKQGRRQLLIGSYIGMACSMFLIVSAISFPLDEGSGQALTVIGTLMYIFTFALGAGPVTGMIIPELSSAQTRSKVMGFSFTVHWVCNFVVGLYFLELVGKFGVGAVYSTFGGVSLLTAVFAYYFIVETKGRSLEEIEMSLSRRS